MGVFLIPPDITIDEKTKKCVGRHINVTRHILSEYEFKCGMRASGTYLSDDRGWYG